MLKLARYAIVWVSQNLSIPFWMVGHVHLSVNVYDDIYEILASMGMNVLVAVGFVLSYIDEQKK
jgi:hydrogenase maturation factor